MLSIIICSRTQAISEGLSMNIKNTVGCKHELIVIDNSENAYSIFEAYNLGIERSKGNFLCFIHDDILFHTKDWGALLQEIFSQEDSLGLIGIAGSKSKTRMPSLWWLCPNEDKVLSIIQHIPNRTTEEWQEGFEQGNRVEVMAIDGVFMACRKNNHILFHSEMMGFHNYDLNLSFEYRKLGYTIMVTNEIRIEHFSSGTVNEKWIESAYRYYSLYKNSWSLILGKYPVNPKQEIANGIWFVTESLKIKNYKIAFWVWLDLFYLNPLHIFHLIYWKNNFKNNCKLVIEYFRKNYKKNDPIR